MPLLETIGSGSVKGFGAGGKKGFSLKSVYSTATVYAPLNDTSLYFSGTKSGSYFVTKSANSTFDVDPLINRDVLQNPTAGSVAKVINRVSVGGINITQNHSVSIWQRSRTGNSLGMLLSKNETGDVPGSTALDIWDGGGGGDIINNLGDSSTNPYSDGGLTLDWKSTTWRHWCFTFDGSTPRMYLNGVFIGSASQYRSFWTNAGNGSWTIGSWASQYEGDYWLTEANFADFAWFNNTVLNSTQVQNIYNAGVGF
jgi:hypothetical protein